MKFTDIFTKDFWSGEPEVIEVDEPQQNDRAIRPTAGVFTPSGTGNNVPAQGYVYAVYDGEKNIGAIGPIKSYAKDFYALRMRSRQAFIESDVCQAVVGRFTAWAIGTGLRLDAEPQIDVLKASKITIDTEAFNNAAESLWRVYANSTLPDYCGQKNMQQLSWQAHLEGKIGGDILVILRVINGIVKVQHIDGMHVGNPPGCNIIQNDSVDGAQSANGYDYIYKGNRIRFGVEMAANGEHVAYHVHVGSAMTYERIPAKDSNGMVRAFMYYGFRPAVDDTRGTPLLSVVLESAKGLDRYREATVSGAEERAKIPYTFEHDQNSDGENPIAGQRVKLLAGQPKPGMAAATDIPVDAVGNKIAADFAVSTNKMVVNLPIGVKAKALDSKQELAFAEFCMFQIDIICAAMNIPPNVAMSKYNDSFSASRMAGEDWQHTFMIDRGDFSQQYLNHIYSLQLYIWILENRIQAPGYEAALEAKNVLVTEAYNYCNFEGDMFPDIDPLKTVKFVREAMGVAMEHVPVMTPEAAARTIGQGAILPIIKQSGKELEATAAAGIELPEQDEPAPDSADNEKEGQTKRKPTSGGNN